MSTSWKLQGRLEVRASVAAAKKVERCFQVAPALPSTAVHRLRQKYTKLKMQDELPLDNDCCLLTHDQEGSERLLCWLRCTAEKHCLSIVISWIPSAFLYCRLQFRVLFNYYIF